MRHLPRRAQPAEHAVAPASDALHPGSTLALDIQGVTKHFRHKGKSTLALDNVDLNVEPGEFICLLGPSGCGKSTLLNIVAGFMKADSGTILSRGIPVTKPGVDRCVLFQQPTLYSWMTTKQNVMFGPKMTGVGKADASERAADLLETVGLGNFQNHYPHQLSGGMRHRVAYARALINKPNILLLDEPFAALDAITRASMQNFLLELWQQERATILFVTHDVEEACLLADRVCVMSASPGRVHAISTVDIPRPRTQATAESAAFIENRRALRTTLEGALAQESVVQ